MDNDFDIKALNEKIRAVKAAVLEMKTAGAGIPALEKNTARILASLKMVEINFADLELLEVHQS